MFLFEKNLCPGCDHLNFRDATQSHSRLSSRLVIRPWFSQLQLAISRLANLAPRAVKVPFQNELKLLCMNFWVMKVQVPLKLSSSLKRTWFQQNGTLPNPACRPSALSRSLAAPATCYHTRNRPCSLSPGIISFLPSQFHSLAYVDSWLKTTIVKKKYLIGNYFICEKCISRNRN